MKKAAAVIAILGLMGFVQHMDYEDELHARAVYCASVHDKELPDYKRTYRSECASHVVKSGQ